MSGSARNGPAARPGTAGESQSGEQLSPFGAHGERIARAMRRNAGDTGPIHARHARKSGVSVGFRWCTNSVLGAVHDREVPTT